MNERISIEMSGMDMIIALGEGNPGALTVCANLIAYGAVIDPQSAFGGFSSLIMLDSLGIYGSRIYMLCNDVCHNDLRTMIGVLIGYQLGHLTKEQIDASIDGGSCTFDIAEIMKKVEESFLRHWVSDCGIVIEVSGPESLLLHEHTITEVDGTEIDLKI